MTSVANDPKLYALRAGSDGTPILFLNSLAADLSMWDGVVGLTGGGATIRFDARGHGRSDAAAAPYGLNQLGADALRVLDLFDVQRAILCGLSLGGLVAQWLAAEAPTRVAGLVLANTASSFPPAAMWRERMDAVTRAGMTPLVEPTLERWLTPRFRAAQPERTAQVGMMIAGTSAAGYAGCAGVLAEADTAPLLHRIDCPTLVVVGDEDPSTPPARGADLAGGIAGAQLVTLRGAHLSAVEDPEGFAGALRSLAERTQA